MSIQDTVRTRLREAIRNIYGLDVSALPVEVPPRTALGDLAFPIAFEVAKRVKQATGQKQNPREIAGRLAAEIGTVEGIARVEVAGAGYINAFFDRARFVRGSLAGVPQIEPLVGGKIIVEHTSVNPNKAAHIGHLRNAVLGDTIVRLLRSSGEQVEVQNYIDNTGVQVADVVVGFKYIEEKTLEQVRAIPGRFDYHCWDLYARVGGFYQDDPARLGLRAETLHELELGKGPTYELADYISTRIVNCHLDSVFRVGVEYDVLPRESDVLHLHLWERAFELLKQRGAVVRETEGRLAGCWVMRAAISPDPENSKTQPKGIQAGGLAQPQAVNKAEAVDETGHEADKVIVRSNGTVTYTGKDIAFHLWKLGQLDVDFYYRPFRAYPDGHPVWMTTSDPAQNHSGHARFGSAAAYFNVIDIGQSYPQHYVKLGVMAVDPDERVERSAHLAYERVVLTPAAAEQLGQRLSDEDRDRGSVSMSGRKGLGVKADDLMDLLEASALAEVAGRHPDLVEGEQHTIAHQIAVGALRYFLLKYTRTSLISFDFKEALAFDGETGPYIQYSVVRANSIFRKLTDAGVDLEARSVFDSEPERISGLLSGEQGDELWSLVYLAMRLSEASRSAISQLEPATVAKWAFQLAQSFNLFYHNHHILSEPDPARRALLVAVTTIVRRQLIKALDLLGIEAPERM
jgi:arginyl-tRNA synthetase